MERTLAVVGLVAEAGAWWLVARGASVWTRVTPVLVALGVAALVAGPPPWSPDVPAATALGVGAGTGIALYLATRVVVTLLSGWRAFERHAGEAYARRGPLSLPAALVVSLALSVPGEELFWRGLVLGELSTTLEGSAVGALLAWGAYLLANLPSVNLAIVAGALVGGALWTALAWWSGGVLAGLSSHVVWTALMLALPPVRAPAAASR